MGKDLAITTGHRGYSSSFRGIWEPTAVIMKHNTPCGVASGATILEAYSELFESDTISAFGGITSSE